MKLSGSYFDKQLELHIPASILGPGELDPKLTPREWLFWIFVSAKDYPGDSKKYLDCLGGPTTLWRTREKLVKKGYL